MNLYVTKAGQQSGPYSELEVRQLLESGDLNPSHLGWIEGSSDWLPISEIISSQAQENRSQSFNGEEAGSIAPAPPIEQSQPYHDISGSLANAEIAPLIVKVVQQDTLSDSSARLRESITTPPKPDSSVRSQRWTAGILAILLGWAGAHKFYLGNNKEGFIWLILGVGSCGLFWIVPLIEGIAFLTMSEAKFSQYHLVGRKGRS